MERICFVYAMDREGEKLIELCTEKYGEPEIDYIITDLETIYQVKPEQITSEPHPRLENCLIHDCVKVGDDLYANVYTLRSFRSDNKELYLVKSDVHNYNAARAGFIIRDLNPDLTFNLGISGALTENLNIGDVVFSTKALYKPIYLEVIKEVELRKPSALFNNMYYSPTLTTDGFCEPENKLKEGRLTGASTVDVESAILASCLQGNIFITRFISDEIDHDKEFWISNRSKIFKEYDEWVQSWKI